MGLVDSYKKRERENIDKEVGKLKKEVSGKTDREILLEILHRVKWIGYGIAILTILMVLYIWGVF